MEKKKGKAGDSIDEFEAHKFLESFGETLTVIELREKLRKIDVNNDKRMALVEYLLFKYPQGSMQKLCESIQREDDPELIEAQRLVQQAASDYQRASDEADRAKEAKLEADRKEAESKAAAASAKSTAESAKRDFEDARAKKQVADDKAAQADKSKKEAEAVEEELRSILAELKKQEDDLAAKIKELEGIAGTPGVKGGQAAAQLLSLKNENPMPLRKAQAEQAVVIKKAEKVRKAAADAAAAAAASAAEATAASNASEQSANLAKEAADAADAAAILAKNAANSAALAQEESDLAAALAQKSLEAAEANVAAIKAKTSSHGSIWWCEKEIEVLKALKPGKKQK